jgi:hypothetical protein
MRQELLDGRCPCHLDNRELRNPTIAAAARIAAAGITHCGTLELEPPKMADRFGLPPNANAPPLVAAARVSAKIEDFGEIS